MGVEACPHCGHIEAVYRDQGDRHTCPQVRVLRGVGRARKAETGDVGAAVFAMAKAAREDGVSDVLLRRAVEDLKGEGVLR